MTGAVDLIVTGDQFVNPSVAAIAAEYNTVVVPTEALKGRNPEAFANEIVEKALNAFKFRRAIVRDIPEALESALMGLSAADLDVKKIAAALTGGKIRIGHEDEQCEIHRRRCDVAQEFLKDDILCISKARASAGEIRFRTPPERKHCSLGVALSRPPKKLPASRPGYAETAA
jgi:hypothetical protein